MTSPTNQAMRRTPLALGCVRGDGGHSRRAGGVRCGRTGIGGGADDGRLDPEEIA